MVNARQFEAVAHEETERCTECGSTWLMRTLFAANDGTGTLLCPGCAKRLGRGDVRPFDMAAVDAAQAERDRRLVERCKAGSALVLIWDRIDAGAALAAGEEERARKRVRLANDRLSEAAAVFVKAWKAAGSPLGRMSR